MYKIFFTTLFLIIFSGNCFGADMLAIIGNKEVITPKDLEDSIKIELVFGGLASKTTDRNLIESIKSVALSRLIDEKLIIYHAKKSDMDIDKIEIAEYEKLMEHRLEIKQNLYLYLAGFGVDKSSVVSKIKALVLKDFFVSGMMKTRALSDEEVDQEIAKNKLENTAENRRKVELFLSIQPTKKEILKIKNQKVGLDEDQIKNELMMQKKANAETDLMWVLHKKYYVEIL